MSRRPYWTLALLTALAAGPAAAEAPMQGPAPAEPGERSVEQLAEQLRPSVVVVTVRGRDARREGLGTGFVVAPDGLIATNLHVIGEGRPISVELADGKSYDVISVEATDRAGDLALVRIDAKGLPALPLGNSGKLKDGQAVVGLGNPHGLKHSVVSGLVSGKRDIDGRPMIQLAIPLEPGNSGGPLVDRRGRVVGILTMKSIVTQNLGFAVGIDALKPLIARPSPVAMEHWVTIGALDPDEWKSAMGARWRQRAGRVQVEGTGTGFGGRSICVYQPAPPALPFEVAVTVRLDDERGAAGLIFRHDGQRHYGFYPTGGKLRLTRFDGPDVFSWKILEDISSPHYRPGEWNSIKVRVEKDGLKGYVNDQLVLESKDAEWDGGQVGLAKFRDTAAEFKNFRVARGIPPDRPSPEVAGTVLKAIDALHPDGPVPSVVVDKLAKQAGSVQALRDRSRELERQAARIKELSGRVHQRRVYDQLERVLDRPEGDIDLVHAALLVAKLDNEDLDVEAYRRDVDRLAKKLAATLPKDADEHTRLKALNAFLFERSGFHGSSTNYYSRSNSYLNEVIDDREGLPITLAVLYIEVGRRVGLEIVGIGLPGHFVVRRHSSKGDGDFIDVFNRAKVIPTEDVKLWVTDESQLEPVKKKAIVVRMLHNLLRAAQEEHDLDAGLRYLDGIVLLEPGAGPERFMRALLRYSKGMRAEAREDVEYLTNHPAEGVDDRRLEQLNRALDKE